MMLRLYLAIAILLVSTLPVRAEIISTAIGLTGLITSLGVTATIGGASVAGAIGGAIVGLGIAAAATFAQQMFAPKASNGDNAKQTPSGVQSSLSVGASVPRNAIFGPQATAGQLAYWNLYGDNNRYLQMVFVLGVGPHDDLTGVYVNGKRCTLGTLTGAGGPPYTPYRPVTEFVKDGNNCMWVRFFNGYYDQIADQELVDNATPAGRWTTDNRGRGVCYVSITMDYIFPELFPQGIPQFLFEVQGLRLYDPRKDSTNGGSGAHRWTDQTTWEYSDNPALALYTFERGLYIGTRKVLGRGLPVSDLLNDLYVAAANVCDESVALKAGGTEKRYRLGMNVGTDRDWSSVEQDFCISFSGWLMESAGAYGPIAGHAQASVVTVTDDDLLAGREVTYSQKRSRSDLINTVFGTYSDPDQNWQPVPYPARASSADVAVDGAELAAHRDYPMIFSLPQVQRAGEIERRLSRKQGSGQMTLGFRFSNIEQGDWFTWTSARRGFTTVFQATQVTVDDDDSITLSFREIASSVFSFNETTDELDPLDPGDLAGIGALVTSVAGFAVAPAQMPGAGGLNIPAIHATWSPILDQTVDEVYIEYRIIGTTDAKVSPTFTPANGEGFITDGVQAATNYEARANILTTPIRETFWTSWTPVTAPPLHIVPHALTAAAAELSATVVALQNEAQRALDRVNQRIASYAAEQDAQNFLEKIRTRSDVAVVRVTEEAHYEEIAGPTGLIESAKVEVKDFAETTADAAAAATLSTVSATYATKTALSQAKVEVTEAAQADADSAIAAYNVTVQAQFEEITSGTGTASSSILLSAASYTDHAIATFGTSISATYATNTALAAINTTVVALDGYAASAFSVKLDVNGYVTGLQLVNGGPGTSVFAVITDNFFIAKPGVSGGAPTQIFTVGTVNGSPAVGILGNLFVDGSIITRTVAADNITRVDAAGGTSAFTWDTNTYTMGSVSVTTAGGDLVIQGTITARSDIRTGDTNATQWDMKLHIYRGGTLVKTASVPARLSRFTTISGSNVFFVIDFCGSFPVGHVENPGAGSFTYSLVMQSEVNKGDGPLNFGWTLSILESIR